MGGLDDFFKVFGGWEQEVCVRCGLKKLVKVWNLGSEERRKNAWNREMEEASKGA